MKVHQIFDSVNIMAIVAALASVKDPAHVSQGRKLNSEVKKLVCSELDSLGYRYIPSHANFMMIDLSSKCGPSSNCSHAATPSVPSIIAALAKRGVEVGRPFPALPSFLRVTIGTSSEMKSFLNAFKAVMG